MEKIKKALVTGGGRGIGSAVSKVLAKNGYEVYVNFAGNTAAAEKTKNEIEQNGGTCFLAKCDLRDADCAEKLYAVTGDIDVLILNASIQHRKKWNEITLDEYDDQMNCNFRSSLLLIQKYAPGMQKAGWGRIITVGSVQEKKPHPDMLVYSSSKAALTLMAQSLSLQLAGTGVTVNSVAPGVVATDRNAEVLADEQYRETVLSKIPLGFCAEAEDVAGTICFLCSDEAKYITGQNIFVDGGMSVK